jgi:hypothetical protein
VFVAFDGEAELAADGAQFGERHVPQLLGPSMALALRACPKGNGRALPDVAESTIS